MVSAEFPAKPDTVNGGTAAAAWYLCTSLVKQEGVELKVVRPFAKEEETMAWTAFGVDVLSIKRPRWLHPVTDFVSRARVGGMARRWEADIIHTQGLASWARYFDVRGLLTVHGILELDALHKHGRLQARLRSQILAAWDGRARRKARQVIAISPYAKQFLGNQSGKMIWDIPNPVGEQFFDVTPSPIPQRFFSASHMTRLKNVHGLVRAFAPVAARFPKAELRLAGSLQDSPYGQECHRLCSDLGIADRVKFLGVLPIEAVRNELTHASCFVLASRQENAPISVSEAMACGVPVIATRVGGLEYMITPGQDGWLVEVDDTDELTRAMMIAASGSDLAGMARRARSVAEQRYHPDRVALSTVEAYRALQKRNSSGV